jgi:hypothetical protein
VLANIEVVDNMLPPPSRFIQADPEVIMENEEDG